MSRLWRKLVAKIDGGIDCFVGLGSLNDMCQGLVQQSYSRFILEKAA